MYKYGFTLVKTCPSGTKPNEKLKICETMKREDVLPGDRIWIIIVALLIIIVQIILSLMLYRYLLQKILEAHSEQKKQKKIHSEEELQYLKD